MTRFLPVLLLASASVASAVPPPQATPEAADTYTVQCTFTNPAYSGACSVSEVTPRSVPVRTACRGILACLNSNQCITKTYCNATTVRGGWRLVGSKKAAQGPR